MPVTVKFARCLSSMAAEPPAKFQSNIKPILWVRDFLRSHGRLLKWALDFFVLMMRGHSSMDHFVYAPSQWEKTLYCILLSLCLGAYTSCSLFFVYPYSISQKKQVHAQALLFNYSVILIHFTHIIWSFSTGIWTIFNSFPYHSSNTSVWLQSGIDCPSTGETTLKNMSK